MTTDTRSRNPVRSVIGGSLGNLVEWYDWYIYSAFSLYFAKSFFPAGDATAQLLSASVVFAIGFLMRPLGGWLLGILADRHGRKSALTWSITLMCAGSLIITCVPTYASIGIWAPVLLTLARMAQGLSLGGEFGTAATYLTEIAPPDKRGFWSSFQYVTLIAGQLLALALLVTLQFFFLTEAQLEAWGWRIAFATGAILAISVFWLRRGIDETPDFLEESHGKRRKGGLMTLIREQPRQVALVFGLSIGSNVSFYAFTTYMQKYLVASAGFAKDQASLVCSAALIFYIVIQPLLGALSDRIGRKPLLYWCWITGVIGTVPLFTAIGAATGMVEAFLLICVAYLIISGSSATSAVVKAELFPAHVRALGVGLPYAVSQAIFGGTAESVALSFKSAGIESAFFWYVAGCMGIALITTLFVPETRWPGGRPKR
ncbi:MFS transporter [Sphingomonadaceae bacterium G21617-S1]|jgi:MHS family alpha-ketoglutarate permease-like MFS transporter|uniref:MFS transporter n=1 Tax=Rhizorhabdus sp. TaxID=1968843 RepID=UPI001206B8F5|nr:MFS transporter [Rhizorhabdus sp.]MBD3760806.1 MFS transporter [Rhizorhabdus sp.]MCZ4341556.1 MFS transporter [Sphingomonadaceae bacterium G21617-S1]TAK06664.1 MAG: MFS transporter [Rhizorhabdus sp.]